MPLKNREELNLALLSSDLNMAPYCSSTADTSQSQYDLFGIINHRGSAWFGHYTSYARLLAHNDPAKTEIGKGQAPGKPVHL